MIFCVLNYENYGDSKGNTSSQINEAVSVYEYQLLYVLNCENITTGILLKQLCLVIQANTGSQ